LNGPVSIEWAFYFPYSYTYHNHHLWVFHHAAIKALFRTLTGVDLSIIYTTTVLHNGMFFLPIYPNLYLGNRIIFCWPNLLLTFSWDWLSVHLHWNSRLVYLFTLSDTDTWYLTISFPKTKSSMQGEAQISTKFKTKVKFLAFIISDSLSTGKIINYSRFNFTSMKISFQ
jgi:hypothetical protein